MRLKVIEMAIEIGMTDINNGIILFGIVWNINETITMNYHSFKHCRPAGVDFCGISIAVKIILFIFG